MRIIDSKSVLDALGYSYEYRVEPAVKPSRVNIRFGDLLPELLGFEDTKWIAQQFLYEHQLEAYRALREGKNVVLRSGTGSGKTEAWAIYFLENARYRDFKAIAVYPTLALANDQIKRLSMYAKAINTSILKLDAITRDELVKIHGVSGLRRLVSEAKLIVTNPAFLLHDIKKLVIDPTKSLLYKFYRSLDMFVIDELDFYSPRSIALLLGILEILTMFSDRKPQIVVLTATLANPEDLCTYLKQIVGRECRIIEGKPFRVENRLYIVLGKEIDVVWSKLRSLLPELRKRSDVDEDIVQALEDLELFKKNAYRVIAYLQALGFDVPSPGLNIEEILLRYVEDDGVTLVFTRSIAKAEELAKKLKSLLNDKADRVASHHHLVPKKLREEIEDKARRGEIKIIVSPRTLMQGIDIGTVIRVVHVGLPEDVREFVQREGRKGRREEIPFTESIVIPSSRWDWELLSKGFEALEKWLSMPLEKTVINPENKYLKLFRALAKVLSPWIPKKFDDIEKEVLREVGVLKGDRFDMDRARWIWERLNFYEFGPPYGIKRYLESSEGLIPLETIGHCDLVERFQVGCFDPSNDAVVTRLRSGRSTRIVTAVIEKPLREFSFYENDAIAEAVEEYRYIKISWGEDPSILRDISRGKLTSYVHCVVYPPRKGFGELKKIPNRVVWYLVSDRPRVTRIGSKHVVTYDRKTIYVPVNTGGEYRDYTYGIIIETDDREDQTLLRLGLAFLMIVLRRVYGIAFETIMYGVERIGEKKFFELHEPEAAGLINKLDWLEVKKAVESYEPDDLDLVLLQQIDDIAYSDMVSLGLDWNIVKTAALRVLDYILMKDRITAKFRGIEVSIPRPSRALKIVTLDALAMNIGSDEIVPRTIVGIAFFDGENIYSYADLYIKYPLIAPPQTLRDLEIKLEDLILYEDFKLVVFDKEALLKDLKELQLKRLMRLVEENAQSLTELLQRIGIERVSLTQLVEALEIPKQYFEYYPLSELHKVIATTIKNEDKLSRLPRIVVNAITKYLKSRTQAIYYLNLIIESTAKS